MKALMRNWKRYVLGIAVFFVIFTLVGFFALPPILKSVLMKKLSETLHREVTIQTLKFNPYSLSMVVQGLNVKEREGPGTFFSLEELFVNLQSLSIFKWALVLKEVRVKQPFIQVSRKADLSYNVSDLLKTSDSKPQPETKKEGKGFKFSLNNISVEKGSIDFRDEPKQIKHTVRDLDIQIPFISNIPYYIQTFIEPALSLSINNTPYSLSGKTKVLADSRETEFAINIRDLNIPYYLAYLPVQLNFKVPSAFMDVRTNVAFIVAKDKKPSVKVMGDVALKEVAIDDEKNNPLVRLQRLDVAIASAEPFLKTVHLSRMVIESPELNLVRNQAGVLNVESRFPRLEERVQTIKKGESPPMAIDVDEIELRAGKITFLDLSPKKPFKTILSPINLRVDHFSNGKDKRSAYTLNLKTEANENVNVEGELSINPLLAEGNVEVQSVPVKKYSPYYSERVLFGIEDGRFDFSTRYRYVQGEKEPMISLSGLSVSMASLRLKRQGEREDFFRAPALALKETEVDLTQKRLNIGSFFTEKGTVTVNRLQSGAFDFLNLFPASRSQEEPLAEGKKGETDKPWEVTIRQATVDQYTVLMNDLATPEPITLLTEKLRLTGENISTAKNTSGKFSLSFLLDKKGTVLTRGTLMLEPMRCDGLLEVKNITVKDYAPYYKDKILFDVEEGIAGLSTNYQCARGEKDLEVRLSGLSVTLDKIQLRKGDESEPFVQIPTLSVRNTGLDLARRDVSIGEVLTERGMILVKRSKDGKLNLQQLFPPSASLTAEQVQGVGDEGAEKRWQVKVARVSVDQYTAILEDEMPEDPATLRAEEVRLKAENLSTWKEEKGTLSLDLQFNQKGTVSIDGSLGIDPLVADVKVDLKDIPINAFQPYFTDRVKILVQEGGITTAGQLSMSALEGNGMRLIYKGDSTVARFVSIDKANAEDFLKWESLAFSHIDIGINPLYVHLGGIALADFYARVMIYPDGTMNLQNIFGQKKDQEVSPPSGPPGTGQEPVKDITIGLITLQGGRIDFADNYVKPNYSVNMVEIGGRISGLSPEEAKTAEVDLRGRLGDGAPMEIAGKINPLSKDLLIDLNIKFKDIELSPLTPFSGKYVGYTIEKGKVSMDLRYLIVKRKLESQNRVFFDQLTLGDRVESPEATKLPIHLAISLLKDPKGEIRLDIPVGGSLDDPKFSVFRVVLQIIGNLLLKAATSPFALLGAVFGGGEQLDSLEFDYGSTDVKGPNENKVNALIKIMQQRPGIKLDIEGHVDLEKDKEELRQLTFNRKMKAQKLKELMKQGQPAVSLDDVKIEPPEYPRYLKMAYKQEKFPKPKNFLGLDKDIPDPEMEKLMFTFIEIKESDLRTLATQRAEKVKDLLTKPGNIEPERIFIVEPKSLASEKKENIRDSRVIFKLK